MICPDVMGYKDLDHTINYYGKVRIYKALDHRQSKFGALVLTEHPDSTIDNKR